MLDHVCAFERYTGAASLPCLIKRSLRRRHDRRDPLSRSRAHGRRSERLRPNDHVLFLSEAYLDRIFPAMRSAYPSEWVQTLKRAESIDAVWSVPGHGFVDDAPTSTPISWSTARDGAGDRRSDAVASLRGCSVFHGPAGHTPRCWRCGPRRLPSDARLPAKANWGELRNWTLFEEPARDRDSPCVRRAGRKTPAVMSDGGQR